MKKIICDICGGNSFIKEGDYFVCQECGTKYTSAQIKEMMVEVDDIDTSNETIKPSSASAAPSSQRAESILAIARAAMDGKNYQEAESNCNKAIEADVNNYTAWFTKGEVIGCQTTLDKSRIVEAAHVLRKAVELAPKEEKGNLIEKADSMIIEWGESISSELKDLKTDTKVNTGNRFMDDAKAVREALTIVAGGDTPVDKVNAFDNKIMAVMTDTAESKIRGAEKVYDMFKTPTDKDKMVYALVVLDGVGLLQEAAKIQRAGGALEDVLFKYDFICDTCLNASTKGPVQNMSQFLELANEMMKARKVTASLIKKNEEKERNKEEENKEARIKEYWKNHTEEKNALDLELSELNQEKEIVFREIITLKEDQVSENTEKKKELIARLDSIIERYYEIEESFTNVGRA